MQEQLLPGSRPTTQFAQPGADSPDQGHLSCDLATFVQSEGPQPDWVDILVIGSGYGGAMALHSLSQSADAQGERPKVLLLERGQRYRPGDFPEHFADVPGHVRTSANNTARSYQGRGHGLFDLRQGDDLQVLLGNGLGGGSLINAGVMMPPLREVLTGPAWPDAICQAADSLLRDMAEVSQLLQAQPAEAFAHRHGVMQAMAHQARTSAKAVPITVRPPLSLSAPCVACAGCFMGCNHGAKLSLDQTLLAQARQQGGTHVRIVTGATVLRIRPCLECDRSGWEVDVVHTHEDARRTQAQPYRVKAKRLILAAGTLGSTEILLRSKGEVAMSGKLGQRFSGNGDNVAFVHGHTLATHGVGDPALPAQAQHSGPTITRCIDLRTTQDMVVEDLGVPGAMRQVFEELTHTVHALHRLTRPDTTEHTMASSQDPARIDPEVTNRSLMVAIIGHDDANGCLQLRHDVPDGPTTADGLARVHWPSLKQDTRFDARQRVFEDMVKTDALGVFANPQYRPLPASLEQVYGVQRGPLLTVHPLGGCAMANGPDQGVVNHLGQVFNGQGDDVYDNLVVLDGAIVPCSLGINPALTIATLAHRAMGHLRQQWGLAHAPQTATTLPELPANTEPVPAHAEAQPARRETQVEATELLWAHGDVQVNGVHTPVVIELELWFQPVSVAALTRSRLAAGREVVTHLVADASRSEVRVFEAPKHHPGPERVTGKLLMRAALHGELGWLACDRSSAGKRRWHSLPAWLVNRGLSDIAKSLLNPGEGHGHGHHGWLGMMRNAMDLATHAGGIRHMHYRLRIGQVKGTSTMRLHAMWGAAQWEGQVIEANKPLSYRHASTPINQLMEAELLQFPHLSRVPLQGPIGLVVDPAYWAEVKVPLVRISALQDMPTALLDMASLGLYVLRALLPIHAWSLRLPDRAATKVPPTRLPGPLPGLPAPEQIKLDMPGKGRLPASHALLTHYGPPAASAANAWPPVLMLHGYSASGTTFAHPSIPHGGLAAYLAQRGREVWVLDMRSSAGLPSAIQPWQFIDMAHHDIPQAIQQILDRTGTKRVDVVAHCMGAAMLTLGLMCDHACTASDALTALPDRIRRIVFSQVGPAVQMSGLNSARTHLMQWLRQMLALGPYELRPSDSSGRDEMLDRLLALVPYPKGDFALENPWLPPWRLTPWVGTRHRMDLFYGVTFQLDQMPPEVLARIDDFFGPLNLNTLTEVLNYADSRCITDPRGVPMVSPHLLRERMARMEGVMSLHSINNQLASPRTAELMHGLFKQADVPLEQIILADMGHQDSLIGQRAGITFEHVHHFLARDRG